MVMPVYHVTQPAQEPVTLAQARAFLRDGLNEDDDLITSLITAAREWVERETGLCLISRQVVELFDDWPASAGLALASAPVREVVSLQVEGADHEASTIDAAHYYLDNAKSPACLVRRDGRHWPRPGIRSGGIRVTLIAGFGANASDVPHALRQAVLMQAAVLYGLRAGEVPVIGAELNKLLQPFRRMRLS
jgi:uncharacterized phiE125 gp8 family phage protein